MRYNYRATYETNSSSAHTMALTNKSDCVTDQDINSYLESVGTDPSKHFRIKVPVDDDGGEYDFGREFRILDTWYEKFAYCLASYRYSADGIKDVMRAIMRRIPNCDGLIVDVYPEGSDDPNAPFADAGLGRYGSCDLGEVDHQSMDNMDNLETAYRSMIDGNATREAIIYETIFSNKIIIIVDGDEMMQFADLARSGFLNDSGIEYVLTDECISTKEQMKKQQYIFRPSFKTLADYINDYLGGEVA